MAAMTTAMVALGGTDNNQPKGVGEERTAAATVAVMETTTANVTATITMLTPMPTTAHQKQQQG
jgi:hypothetical protein